MSSACKECAPEIRLEHLSPKLYDYLVMLQAELRIKHPKKKLTSLEHVIFKIIADHKHMQEQGKFLLKLTNEQPEEKAEGSD